MPNQYTRVPFVVRFWRRVDKSGDCWLWTGPLYHTNGYGVAFYEGRNQPVHRIAWKLAYGPIPDGLLVCHTCDVRNCVKPDHLFLGAHQDNSDDMHAKERGVFLPGERNGRAKLTDEIVAYIREAYAGGATQVELGRQFGVGQTTVSRIVRRQHWRHV